MTEYAVFDKDAAFERVDNDTELYFELIDMFFEEYPGHLEALSAAVSEKDFVTLEKSAHALKSALGNLGAMTSYDLSFKLEQGGRDEVFDGMEEYLAALQREVAAFKEEVEKHK